MDFKPLLETKDLSYTYENGRKILSDLSFVLKPSELCCVVGPNGSGKSTFLKAICGVDSGFGKRTGQILWNGKPLEAWKPIEFAKTVAFVPPLVSTSEPLTVREFALQGRYAFSKYWQTPNQTDENAVNDALALSGISSLAAERVSQISTGQFQLALLARALTQEPSAIICDETVSNLDLSFQKKVFDLFKALLSKGKSVLLVCHDLNSAAEFASTIAFFKDGRFFKKGRPEEMVNTNTVQEVFGRGQELLPITVGQNPISKKPKIFWTT